MHVLIVGMTESGKTTLAKRLANRFRSKGVGVLVLDPMHDPEWSADFQTSDPGQFLDVCRRSTSCALFVDEAGAAIGRYDAQYDWLATRSRHFGHSCHFLTQRGAQLNPTVRGQCSGIALFAVNRADADLYAKEWNCDLLRSAPTLQRGEFIWATRFGTPRKEKLW